MGPGFKEAQMSSPSNESPGMPVAAASTHQRKERSKCTCCSQERASADLTTAPCCLREGMKVTLLEQAKELKEVGAGVQISSNRGDCPA